MDLHAWITEHVDRAEAAARESIVGRSIAFTLDDGRTMTGTVTSAGQGADGVSYGVAQYGVEPVDTTPAPIETATAALRRCEADRRILNRHRADPDRTYDRAACIGCGTYGYMDHAVTDNLNDCPELLDLGHAHGLTEAVLAGLDRPQPPTQAGTPFDAKAAMLQLAWAPNATNAISDLPPAFRGPRWSATH